MSGCVDQGISAETIVYELVENELPVRRFAVSEGDPNYKVVAAFEVRIFFG